MSRRDSARPRAERAEGRPAAEAAPEPGLWRHGDFRRYWGGQAVTVAGFGITTIGISVIAVVDLHASTMHVALIAVAGKLPALLLSLHAGVLADRYRKRPIIITCDVLCALTLSSIPLAQFVGQVTLGQLYAVAFLVSAFQVVGSNASISYLPTLLREKQLKEGNAKLGATNSLADLAGNNLGGLLVTVLGAARAIAVDALSYLVCAFCLLTIRHREPEPAPRPAGSGHWTEIREGLDYTLQTPVVRSIVLSNATTSFALAASSALWSLYLLRELSWSPTALGIVMGAGGVGGFLGALLWRRWERRWGAGPVMLTALAINPLAQIPLVLVGPGTAGQAVIGTCLLIQTGAAVAHGGLQRSVRQELCPAHLQGRAQATGAWLASGLRPVAAFLAGVLGTLVGLRSALGVITFLLCAPLVILWRSPVRGLHPSTVPAFGTEPAPAGAGSSSSAP
ncbi:MULTISPECIES: MFS transporter [Streptomyces]|uniref:MFS transporter n=1 Tax=Streptomyces TaxID=1883 RepID=UPI000D0A974B|nr:MULTISPECIES: MFS transporter [Streptomyces]MCX4523568.1 MFS transporter [Streptomyces anulatus]MCX4606578.1 MFS transporter [Streptomyces anulatus]WSI82270.1 MFS transporter [Streptomyces anulatus]WTD23344.1 MFS transporter [Streptomyces anulatus]